MKENRINNTAGGYYPEDIVCLNQNKQERLSMILFIVLILLRFPLLFAAAFGLIDDSYGIAIYLCGTYFCTGLFICLNRTRLDQFNFSFAALFLFFMAPIAGLINNGDDYTVWLRLVMAIGFAVYILFKRNIQLVKVPKSKIALNMIFTLMLCIAVPLLFWAIGGFESYESEHNPLSAKYVIDLLCFHFAFAAVSEEPLFRGFMTGYLRKRGMKELTICIAVAFAFWMGHIYYIGTGINFWLIHPIAALLFSVVAMKTKSVSYPMILHSCINAFTEVLRLVRL